MANKYIDLAMNASGDGYKLINLEGGGAPVPPTPPGPDYSKEYLTIEALENGDFTLNNAVKYSKNDGDWISAASGTTLSLTRGDKVSFKSLATRAGKGLFSGNTLSFNIMGNIMSVQDEDNFENSTTIAALSGMSNMCYNCTGLENAENLILPATVLKNTCYSQMFRGCSNLKTTPKILPALEIVSQCYYGMFNGCSKITEGPQIMATSTKGHLDQQALIYMFVNCTSLVKAPDILLTTLTSACCQQMFENCASLNYVRCLATNPNPTEIRGTVYNWLNGVSATGTFVKKAGVTWSSGASGIPEGWTVIEE